MLRARSGLSFGPPAPLPGSEAARPRRLANPRRDDRSSLISPVVLRGLVRFVDFTLATGIGAAIAYLLVDMPSAAAAEALYLGTIVATSLAAVLLLRSPRPLLLARLPLDPPPAAAHSPGLDGGVRAPCLGDLLLQGRRAILARLARTVVRDGTARHRRGAHRALRTRTPMDAIRTAISPRRHLRHRADHREIDPRARGRRRERRAHRRHLRRSQDFPRKRGRPRLSRAWAASTTFSK